MTSARALQGPLQTAGATFGTACALALCLLASVALIELPLNTFFSLGAEMSVWMTGVVLLGLMVCAYRASVGRHENPWTAAMTVIALFYFVRFGWGALVAYYWGFLPFQAYPMLRNLFQLEGAWNDLPRACHLALLSGMGVFLGAAVPGRRLARALPRLDWQINPAKLQRCVTIYILVVPLLYWLISKLLPPSLVNVALIFASVTDTMFVVLSYFFFNAPNGAERVKRGALLGIAYVLALPMAALSGQMVPLLMPGLMILCGWVLARRSVPWKWLIAGIPVLFLVVLPFATYLKTSPSHDKLAGALDLYSASPARARIELALSRSVARFSGVQFPAIFSKYYPDVYGYQWGRTFAIESSGLVPRALWRDKPEISGALNAYSVQVGIVQRGSGTSAVFDAVSEYYINFGAPGVFLLSVLHGWVLATMYEWLVPCGNYVVGSSIFLWIVVANWDFFGIVQVITAQMKGIPIWLLLYRVMSKAYGPRVAS